MKFTKLKKILVSLFVLIMCFSEIKAESINKIEFIGNERISNETITMLSNINSFSSFDENSINRILKNLYDSNFFKNIEISLKENILKIKVEENPLINKIKFEGIKSKRILGLIKDDLILKERSSFNEVQLDEDINKISASLKTLGYYFANIETYLEELDDNKINLNYNINIGDKAKIKKINFIGNKIYKDGKLKNIIISEEYKFWKIISGKKYLNEAVIDFDKRLLKNFYLNNGYYDVEINSSFAKLTDNNEFELIYNIDANDKIFFNELKLTLPLDYNKDNFTRIDKLFSKLKGEAYSINSVEEIIEEIEIIVLDEQFESTKAKVKQEIISNQINLEFSIEELEKYTVERINIFGNNVTRESVIRNNLSIDEGDVFNELLTKKSENNIKSLNIFRDVETKITENENLKTKIIEITVEEKPTGEIMAGAGFGTDGGSFSFGIKENNYLGRGIAFDTNLTLNEDSIKGNLGITNPNYKNSDKSLALNVEISETDKLKDFGYKTNKNGFSIDTNFEYFKDLNLGLGTSTYYETIETDSSASVRQKKMAGDYWDTFAKVTFDYDKRNQKFKTSKGYRSFYNVDIPIISDTNTLTNTYNYKFFTELFEENVTSAGILLKSANSLTDDIKLSERLFIPSRRLRGFESGKVGPKDGNDYIGGNFVTTMNFTSTIPQLFPTAQSFEFLFFIDAANIWGVDYDSSLDKNNDIRSSVGLAVDWMTVVGPLNFSFAQPITKSEGDKLESFRFNLGTTF